MGMSEALTFEDKVTRRSVRQLTDGGLRSVHVYYDVPPWSPTDGRIAYTRLPKRADEGEVWMMGSDNLAQFHLWREWRRIARTMPIAVIARPGYDAAAVASPAMAWLRHFRVPLASFRNGGEWSAPALVTLRFDPDPRSATAIRRADPDWASRHAGKSPRDQVTHRLIPLEGDTATQ